MGTPYDEQVDERPAGLLHEVHERQRPGEAQESPIGDRGTIQSIRQAVAKESPEKADDSDALGQRCRIENDNRQPDRVRTNSLDREKCDDGREPGGNAQGGGDADLACVFAAGQDAGA